MNCTDCMSRNGYCPKDCKKTNADRIRSMTDEELAEFLLHVQDDAYDAPYGSSLRKLGEWFDWLKEEVEE